jgi:hypothetical protein
MGWADDAPQILGTDALPAAAAPDAGEASAATQSQGGEPGGMSVPVGPPAQQPSQSAGASGLPPELVAALRVSIRPNSAARFASALGAGLASVGQNWNKPGGAAFAASAGAAMQGADKAQHDLAHTQIAALNAAIHALRAGDMIAYHRSLAQYHQSVAEQRRRHAVKTPPTPPLQPEPAAPAAPATVPPPAAAPQPEAAAPEQVSAATAAEPAAPDPQVVAAHRTTLERLLGDAGVPPQRVEPTDIAGAAHLMATKALPATEAFETAALHGALAGGHASPAEIDLIYGPGAADAIRSAATS